MSDIDRAALAAKFAELDRLRAELRYLDERPGPESDWRRAFERSEQHAAEMYHEIESAARELLDQPERKGASAEQMMIALGWPPRGQARAVAGFRACEKFHGIKGGDSE